jgi:hypothetical protein
MRPWSIVAAVLAALGILLLVAYGSDGGDFSGRASEGVDERAAQQLVAQPVALGPEPAIAIVLERGHESPDEVPPYAAALLPPATAALLEEVRGLLTTAAGQPADQAKATLEQVGERLDLAIDQVEEAADDTSNDVRRIRLLQLQHTLEAIRDVVEDNADQL